MHRVLLAAHSLNRWLVVVMLVVTLAAGILGWVRGRGWTRRDDLTGRLLIIVLDVQLVLGLALYALSPIVRAGWSDLGAAMDNRVLQFWTVEHAPTMILAIVIVHVGRVMARRGGDDARRHRVTTLSVAVATLLILAGIPWPFLETGRPLLPWL
jgi:hypothetical protein